MIGLALLFFGIGLKGLQRFKNRDFVGTSVKKEDCRKGHTWRSFPAAHDPELEYLKCIACNKTLQQIIED